MRAAIDTRAEIVKLARLLGVEPARLDYLLAIEADDVRRVREQATDALFDADRAALERAAGLSGVLPAKVTAQIAERALGPLLCARIAGLVDADRAVDLAKRMSPAFLADVATQMDPRRASDVIARMPAEPVVAVTEELAARDEHVAMGRFVGHLDHGVLAATFAAIDDPGLLRIAFTMEGKERLDEVVALLPDERLAGVTRAAEEVGLWTETLDLVSHLGTEQRARVARLAAEEDPAVLAGMVAAAHEEDLWPLLLEIASEMDPDARREIVAAVADAPDEVFDGLVAALVDAAGEHPDLLEASLPLLADLDAPQQERAAHAVRRLDARRRKAAAELVRDRDLAGPLGPIAAALEEG